MITRRTIGRASLALVLLVPALTACGGGPALGQPSGTPSTVTAPAVQTVTVPTEAGATTTATPEPAQTTLAQSGAAAACAALQSGIEEIVQIPVTQTEAPLDDFVTGATLQGCQLTAKWTGAQMDDFVEVSRQARVLLMEQGWTEDQRYTADDPTGTVLGFTRDDLVAILGVDWQPGPEVQCPADKPITECGILPEQRHYSLTLKIGGPAGGTSSATPVAPDNTATVTTS